MRHLRAAVAGESVLGHSGDVELRTPIVPIGHSLAVPLELHMEVRDLSFYGAQIHVVVSGADRPEEKSVSPRALLEGWLTQAGIVVHSIDWIAPSLEDVFIAKMREVPMREQRAQSTQSDNGK